MSFEILNSTAITAAFWGYALVAILGLAVVASVAIPAVVRNRNIRLTRHQSVREYYGSLAFTH